MLDASRGCDGTTRAQLGKSGSNLEYESIC